MSTPRIAVVIPTIRPEQHTKFVKAWSPLFEKHQVTLITVWDGEKPKADAWRYDIDIPIGSECYEILTYPKYKENRDLFYRFTDACRNIGFVYAAQLGADYILTLDDDVEPVSSQMELNDPIQDHIDTLNKRVPISWVPTFHVPYRTGEILYPRGMPYTIRDEAPVMLSHGVWGGVLDWDGETQCKLEKGNDNLGFGYFKNGPIPKGVLFPMCGMNVMIRKEAFPYFYFSPMGPDTGIEGLNRFADIWCGIYLKREFDKLGWACYTGGSVVHHTRASDARKNMEQERLGREWNEWLHYIYSDEMKNSRIQDRKPVSKEFAGYINTYQNKRQRYAELIRSIQSPQSSEMRGGRV